MKITILRIRHENQNGSPTENDSELRLASTCRPLDNDFISILRHGLKIATGNVLTLLPDGQDSLASLEFDKYNLDLSGLFETHWRDSGEYFAGNYHYVWSGPNDNSGKVGQGGPRHVQEHPKSTHQLTAD